MNYYFVGLLIMCTIYGLVAGGAPERIAVVIYAVASHATYLVLESHSGPWRSLEVGVLIIDVATFVAFTLLAMRADRFWLIWVSALLGLGVLGHLGRWVALDMIPWAYAVVLAIWSYPILAIIAVGTFYHRRRLAKYGTDKSWSSFAP